MAMSNAEGIGIDENRCQEAFPCRPTSPQSYYVALLRVVNQYSRHGYVEPGKASCSPPSSQSYYDALLRLVNQYSGHGYVEPGRAS